MNTFLHALNLTAALLQRLAFGLVIFLSAASVGYTVLSLIGVAPWLEMNASLGGAPIENAGIWAQAGLTVFAMMLAFYLPTARRVIQLENSHRSFHLGMQDVAQAYHHAHSADRRGVFHLSSEFHSVRERLLYLRDHPDLGSLEPEVLELAAQMSHVSQELADTYSDDAIDRARAFLKQRQQEVDTFNARLDQAKAISTEIKRWLHEVELEESVAAAQLERLRDELHEALPELGSVRYVAPSTDDDNIAQLPRAAE